MTKNEPINISDNSVIIDESVIGYLLHPSNNSEMLLRLKMLALSCDSLIVFESSVNAFRFRRDAFTPFELVKIIAYLDKYKTNRGLSSKFDFFQHKHEMELPIRVNEALTTIESVIKQTIQSLNISSIDGLLKSKIFRIVSIEEAKTLGVSGNILSNRDSEIFRLICGPDIGQAINPFLKARSEIIEFSNIYSVPVLTYDSEFQEQITNVRPVSVILDLPFPFDSQILHNLDINEIFNLSAPLRQIYRKTFQRIKSDYQRLSKLKVTIDNNNELLEKQRELLLDKNLDLVKATQRIRQMNEINNLLKRVLAEVNLELIETAQKIGLWKNLAKPNMRETILWTIIELGLGVIPFPMPTSPVSHFIQAMRYKNLENSLSNEDN